MPDLTPSLNATGDVPLGIVVAGLDGRPPCLVRGAGPAYSAPIGVFARIEGELDPVIASILGTVSMVDDGKADFVARTEQWASDYEAAARKAHDDALRSFRRLKDAPPFSEESLDFDLERIRRGEAPFYVERDRQLLVKAAEAEFVAEARREAQAARIRTMGTDLFPFDYRARSAWVDKTLALAGAVPAPTEWRSAMTLAHEAQFDPPAEFLVRGLWPSDAYGILGAEWKAGKTWLMLDLAVAVATGGKFLGLYDVEAQGGVLMFLGEGGRRKMTRRFNAVCDFYAVNFGDLDIEIVFRAPNLTDEQAMADLADKLEDGAVLVIVDPLYLSTGGAKLQLAEVGALLSPIQHVCQEAEVALMIAHHWNQTGEGSGASRFSGAGAAEWGRCLISAAVKAKSKVDPLDPTGESSTTLEFSVVGDEIGDTTFRIRRRVWSDDKDVLGSPMHYVVEPVADLPADPTDDLRPADRRVLACLDDSLSLTVKDIGDRLAHDPTGRKPLTVNTIQASLRTLAEGGLAREAAVVGRTGHWLRTSGPSGMSE